MYNKEVKNRHFCSLSMLQVQERVITACIYFYGFHLGNIWVLLLMKVDLFGEKVDHFF